MVHQQMSKVQIANLLVQLQTEIAQYLVSEPRIDFGGSTDLVTAILSSPDSSKCTWSKQREILAFARQLAGLCTVDTSDFSLELGLVRIMQSGGVVVDALERVFLDRLLQIQTMDSNRVRQYLLAGGSPTLLARIRPEFSAETVEAMICLTQPTLPDLQVVVQEERSETK